MVAQVKELNDHEDISTIHFVETAPSMLREMPWIQQKDIKVSIINIIMNFNGHNVLGSLTGTNYSSECASTNIAGIFMS